MTDTNDSFHKDLYKKIKSSLSEQEKILISEWFKEVEIDGKKYELEKNKNDNHFLVKGNEIEDELFLGTTTFIDSGIEFIPNSSLDLKRYIKKKSSKDFKLDSKSLNKKEIYEICFKGESKRIIVIYSPFLNELKEDIFNEKNLKGELDNLKIQDLSLFYLEYFPSLVNNNQDSKYINSEDRKQLFKEIKSRIKDRKEYTFEPIELYGPFGIGKSCSLLAFQKAKLFGKSAYFNLNSIFRLKDNKDKVKKMVLYESMSLFNNFSLFSKLKDIVIKKEFDNPWDIIKEVINFIFNNTDQYFVIILDQYKEIYKNLNLKSSEKLDSILLNGEYGITLIKCSSMNDEDVKLNFINSFESNKYIYIDKLFELEDLDNREKLYFGTISLFHFLYTDSKKEFNDFIVDEKKRIKSDIRKSIPESTNLLKVISNISNIMKIDTLYSEEDIKKMANTIPLKYILLKKTVKDNKKFYTLDYPCLLIKIVFEELAVEELIKLKDTNGIKELRGTVGAIFEIICHFAILANKLENFNLKSENLFYLEKNIYNNKENEKNWKINKIDAEKMKNLDSFYIRPTNTNSELYDSIIVFKKDGKFSGYLFQMSISKEHGKKIVSREKHYNAIDKVKKKIKEIYNIYLENVYFSYIFNFDDIMVDDIIECQSSQVDYFFFSMEENKFYQLNIEDKTKNKIKKNEKSALTIAENERISGFHITELDFNLLSNMNEKKINTQFIKSKLDLENSKYDFLEFLNKKRYYKSTTDILDDLEPIKKIIKRKSELKIEIYCESGNVNKVLNYLKSGEYVCLIKINNNKIYMIYNKATYAYNDKEKAFILVNDNLGTMLWINEINVEYEIFSIIQ